MSIYKKKNAILIDLNPQMNNTEITPQSSVELPTVTIGNQLKLDHHISKLCKSAGCQFNALFRLKYYLNYEQQKVLIESLYMQTLSTVHQSDIFGHTNQ